MPRKPKDKAAGNKAALRRKKACSELIWRPSAHARAPESELERKLHARLLSLGYTDINDPKMPEATQLRLGVVAGEVRKISRKLTPGRDTQLFYQWRATQGEAFQRDVDAIHFFSSFYVLAAWTIEQLAELPSGSRVAELGAGVGGVLNLAAAERPDLVFHGIDIASESLEVARRDAAALGLKNITYSVSDALRDPPLELAGRHDALLVCRLLHETRGLDAAPDQSLIPLTPKSSGEIPVPVEKWLRPGGKLCCVERFPSPHCAAQFVIDIANRGLRHRVGSLELQRIHDQAGEEWFPAMAFDYVCSAVPVMDIVDVWSHLLQPLEGMFEENPYYAFVQFVRCVREFGCERLESGESSYGPARWAQGRHVDGSWIYMETGHSSSPPRFIHFPHGNSDLEDQIIADWLEWTRFQPTRQSGSTESPPS